MISANHGVIWKGHYISSRAELTAASLKGCRSGWFTSLFLYLLILRYSATLPT